MEIVELPEQDISSVLPLSSKIFGQQIGTFHHIFSKWTDHYKNDGILLGAFKDNELVGYIFGYRVDEDEFHYWMGGVGEKHRGNGIGRSLLTELEKKVKEEGYKKITVNTYKEKWQVQYGFLLRHGYNVYKEEEIKWDDGKMHIKSFLIKNL